MFILSKRIIQGDERREREKQFEREPRSKSFGYDRPQHSHFVACLRPLFDDQGIPMIHKLTVRIHLHYVRLPSVHAISNVTRYMSDDIFQLIIMTL